METALSVLLAGDYGDRQKPEAYRWRPGTRLAGFVQQTRNALLFLHPENPTFAAEQLKEYAERLATSEQLSTLRAAILANIADAQQFEDLGQYLKRQWRRWRARPGLFSETVPARLQHLHPLYKGAFSGIVPVYVATEKVSGIRGTHYHPQEMTVDLSSYCSGSVSSRGLSEVDPIRSVLSWRIDFGNNESSAWYSPINADAPRNIELPLTEFVAAALIDQFSMQD